MSWGDYNALALKLELALLKRAELERDLAAANARADAAERGEAAQHEAATEWEHLCRNAEARAEAAERQAQENHLEADKWESKALGLETERDQLATRVTELDALLAQETLWRLWATERLCTPAERRVLDACAKRGPLKIWGAAVWEAEKARREASRGAKART